MTTSRASTIVALCLVVGQAAAAQGHIITTSDGKAFAHLDSAWVKPPLRRSTIKMQGGKISCGANGDGGDTLTNVHKNRADTPDSSYLVALDAIRELKDTSLWRHGDQGKRDDWTDEDRALVGPYEGLPLTVVGYFEIVKPQKKSAPRKGKKVGESVNCHSWAELDTDWHISLTATPEESEEEGVVVEPTPRTKRRNKGWDAATAKSIAVREAPSAEPDEENASQVRVTGFLMLDPAHPGHIRGACKGAKCASKSFYRATLWELHPVTSMEVLVNGKWVRLQDLQ